MFSLILTVASFVVGKVLMLAVDFGRLHSLFTLFMVVWLKRRGRIFSLTYQGKRFSVSGFSEIWRHRESNSKTR